MPMTIRQTFKGVNSIAKSIEAKAPTFALMRKEMGDEDFETLLVLNLTHTFKMLNVARPMSGEQISMLAKLILEECWMLTMSDLKLFCDNIMTGKYKTYESISINVVMEWVCDYREKRIEYAMNNRPTQKFVAENVWQMIPEDKRREIFDSFKADATNKEEDFQKFRADYITKNLSDGK